MIKSSAPIRILFMGTPDFAIPSLYTLHATPYTLVGVITQPDKPTGRKQIFTPPPVKKFILSARASKAESRDLSRMRDIPILQPQKLRDPQVIEQIRSLEPDLIVVAAYGQIIPKAILEIPKFGTLNVHPSLLPKYRGASPIQAAIASGDTETGVTIMQLDEQLDHGPIIAQTHAPIAPNETGGSLSEKLSHIGAELLIATISDWIAGKTKPKEQDHLQATLTKQLTREDGKIDWTKSAEEIERKIRAYNPWPGSWTVLPQKHKNTKTRNQEIKLKILKAVVLNASEGYPMNVGSGTTIKTQTGSLAVACGSGTLEILELQLEGKRRMSSADFLRGNPNLLNSHLN